MVETDGQVMGWAEAGDPAAFVELFWRHGPAVHAYLARRAGRQAADDLLSEVWLQAFKGRANYDRQCIDARPWLYGIARHVLHAHWRRSARPVAVAPMPAVSDFWPEVDERLDAATRREELEQAVATLGYSEREVLLLVVWERLAPAEVAVVLGIPQGTARSRLHRALAALRADVASGSSVPLHLCSKEA